MQLTVDYSSTTLIVRCKTSHERLQSRRENLRPFRSGDRNAHTAMDVTQQSNVARTLVLSSVIGLPIVL